MSVFHDNKMFDDANTRVEQVELRAADNLDCLAWVIEMHSTIWHLQRKLEDAKSEALGALEIFGNLRAATGTKRCSDFLRKIEQAMENHSTAVRNRGELLEITLDPTPANFPS